MSLLDPCGKHRRMRLPLVLVALPAWGVWASWPRATG